MKKRKIGKREQEIIDIENFQIRKYGFVRWKIDHRYGYVAIDEMNETGECMRNHRAGLTHNQALQTINDLMTN